GSVRRWGALAVGAPRPPLGRLDFAVLRRRGGDQRAQQPLARSRDLVDGAVEGLDVGLRGLRRAADLAHVLERGRADLFLRRRRVEVVESSDVPAHALKVSY